MNYTHIIREIGRGSAGARDMSREEAQLLYGAMLDGGVPDLELGAIAIALRMKGESNEEMVGFLSAARERLHSLRRPQGRIRPVVIPSYNGARKSANLTPLLALLLQRFGVPVLVHGLIEGYGRVTSAQIFREFSLGSLLPCTSHAQAQQAMDEHGLAYVPLSVLSPGLNDQLALRARLGLRNSAHSLVKMLDPFKGEGLMLAAATHPDYIDTMRDVLSAVGARAAAARHRGRALRQPQAPAAHRTPARRRRRRPLRGRARQPEDAAAPARDLRREGDRRLDAPRAGRRIPAAAAARQPARLLPLRQRLRRRLQPGQGHRRRRRQRHDPRLSAGVAARSGTARAICAIL